MSKDDIAQAQAMLADVLLGEPEAEAQLVDSLTPVIRAVAAGFRLGNAQREDLIQDVWLHLWEQNCRVLQAWDKRGPLGAFIRKVARNRIQDRARRYVETGEPLDPNHDPPDPGPDGLTLIEAHQLADCIERTKQYLSPQRRHALDLRHKEDLEPEEIAARLHKSLGAVYQAISRAESDMREFLREQCADHLESFPMLLKD